MHAYHCPPDPSTPSAPAATATGDHSPVPRSRPALVHAAVRSRGPAGHVVTEWERLARSRAVLRHVNSWEFVAMPVSHLDEVLELCGFGKRVDDSDADHMFLCLVRLAAHDELAARVALHRVLPAIMAVAKRRGRIHPQGAHAAMSELLTTAWEVIRTYPCERRPKKIAANIVRDIEYFTYVRESRLKRVTEVCVESDHSFGASPDDEPTAAEELCEVLADAAAAGLDPNDLSLLRRYAAGESTQTIAESLGLSPRTVRNRRRAALDEVRRRVVGIE